MKEKLKQLKFRFIEFRYYHKYWRHIPKGVRRSIIELSISLGELTDSYNYTNMNGKPIDNVLDIAKERNEYIRSYIDFISNAKEDKNK